MTFVALQTAPPLYLLISYLKQKKKNIFCHVKVTRMGKVKVKSLCLTEYHAMKTWELE